MRVTLGTRKYKLCLWHTNFPTFQYFGLPLDRPKTHPVGPAGTSTYALMTCPGYLLDDFGDDAGADGVAALAHRKP